MNKTFALGAVVAVVGSAMSASAAIVTLQATLSGANEVPANTSTATGSAIMVIDTDTRAFTLDLTFTGLTTPSRAGHIHNGAAGTNGPVIFGLDSAATWALIPGGTSGVTSFTTCGPVASPTLFPAAQLANLLAGNNYVNIHSTGIPSGELRGQLVVIPAPAALGAFGLVGLVAVRRQRRGV